MKILIIAEINSDNLGDRAIYLNLKNLFESQGHTVSGLDLSRSNQFCIAKNGVARTSINNLCMGEEHLPPVRKRGGEVSFKSTLISIMPDFVLKVLNLYLKRRRYMKHEREWTEIIKDHNLVIFGGGALLMDNNWSFPLAMLYASRLVRNLGVPYGCVGVSVGEIFSLKGRQWLKEFLSGNSFIILRDRISGIHLQKLGVSQYKVYIDPAICTRDIIKVERGLFKGVIGINILSYVRRPHITKRHYYRYLEVMKKLIIRIAETLQLGFKQVILFNTGEPDDVHASQILYFQLRKKLKNIDIKVCRKMQNLEELCYLVSQCDVVIGARLHASIISKSYGIPIIGIDWGKKVAGFYEMIKLKDFCFDYRTCNAKLLMQSIQRIKADNFCQKTNLEEHIKEVRKMPDYIAQKAGLTG
jgi:polysaccharide pyruvyl transferase WcaK-like protein